MRRLLLAPVLILAACSPEPATPVALADLCTEARNGARVSVEGVVVPPDGMFITCRSQGTSRATAVTRCGFPLVAAVGDTSNVKLMLREGDGDDEVTITEPEGLPGLDLSGIGEEAGLDFSDLDTGSPGEVVLRDADGEARRIPAPVRVTGEVTYLAMTRTEGSDAVCEVTVDEVRWPEG